MKIELPYDHNGPKDSQLIIAITGGPKEIKVRLMEILMEMENTKSFKPCQGTSIQFGCTSTIITPVWGGKECF